jgi:hypothetical protein
MDKADLLKVIADLEERFRVIKGLLLFEYGSVSNDDLIGIIHDTVPPYIEPKKLN